jgi:hypothetical protein
MCWLCKAIAGFEAGGHTDPHARRTSAANLDGTNGVSFTKFLLLLDDAAKLNWVPSKNQADPSVEDETFQILSIFRI